MLCQQLLDLLFEHSELVLLLVAHDYGVLVLGRVNRLAPKSKGRFHATVQAERDITADQVRRRLPSHRCDLRQGDLLLALPTVVQARKWFASVDGDPRPVEDDCALMPLLFITPGGSWRTIRKSEVRAVPSTLRCRGILSHRSLPCRRGWRSYLF